MQKKNLFCGYILWFELKFSVIIFNHNCYYRVTSSVAKSHGLRGKSQRGNHPKSPRPPKKSSSEHDTVTLDDVKGL